MATYKKNPKRAAQLAVGVDQGLKDAATLLRNDVMLRFKARNQGYTTGAFSDKWAGVHKTITRGEPETVGTTRRILVGTNKRSDDGFSYPLAWELGHYNTYLRRYIRVETFRPALMENADRLRRAFALGVKRVVGP
jgi:hypothetical protein